MIEPKNSSHPEIRGKVNSEFIKTITPFEANHSRWTMVIPKKEKQKIAVQNEILSREVISKILGSVSYSRAFFFYEAIGKPIGEAAISLLDFSNKINTVPPKCLFFHLSRGDFENWIREIIGDVELAKRIGNIRAKKEHTVKKKLYQCVSNRITELQDMWAVSLTMPEGISVSQ